MYREMAFKDDIKTLPNLISFINACTGSDLVPITSVLVRVAGIMLWPIKSEMNLLLPMLTRSNV